MDKTNVEMIAKLLRRLCVCEREREREREMLYLKKKNTSKKLKKLRMGDLASKHTKQGVGI